MNSVLNRSSRHLGVICQQRKVGIVRMATGKVEPDHRAPFIKGYRIAVGRQRRRYWQQREKHNH